MKKIILLLALSFYSIAYSQIHDPVQWSTSVEKISETEYNLIMTSSIEENWHLYSQTVPEGGR
ncbi:MAG: hypothetical protein ABJH82_08895 [Polaribacter sp.]|uniref:hypothetical protein n=1 Tax=Polaribacter sp. TaxID=1920175 RepID=UPI00326697AD